MCHLLQRNFSIYCLLRFLFIVSDVTTKTKQPLISLLQVCLLVFASAWNKVIMIIIMIAIITVRIITIIVVLIVKSKVV